MACIGERQQCDELGINKHVNGVGDLLTFLSNVTAWLAVRVPMQNCGNSLWDTPKHGFLTRCMSTPRGACPGGVFCTLDLFDQSSCGDSIDA